MFFMALTITCFPALYGDCFLIDEPECEVRFLVDCGFKLTFQHHIKKKIDSVDFIILTHSDEDHINGAFPLLNEYPDKFSLKKVYVNSPESIELPVDSGPISIRQAKNLVELLREKEIAFQGLIQGDFIKCSDNISLEIISPTLAELTPFNEAYDALDIPVSMNLDVESFDELIKKPDSFPKVENDIANASSIAFILHYSNKKILFLGDSHPEVISKYLLSKNVSVTEKLRFDYIKLSHHGSSKSISKELLELISCSNFIISTNGGKGRSKHPNRETIAKLAKLVDRDGSDYLNLYFNYRVEDIEVRNGSLLTSQERETHKINCFEQNEIIFE
jgi:hypothetical protein